MTPMKSFFFILFLFALRISAAQTGSLNYTVYINTDDDADTYALELNSGDVYLEYELDYDGTIDSIPVGVYKAIISGNERLYRTSIEIEDNTVTELYINIEEYLDTETYENDSITKGKTNEFVNVNWQFGTGLPLDVNNQWNNSFDFSYTIGPDWRLGNSPFTLGFETGLAYQQTNYGSFSFSDTSVFLDRQSFSNFSLPISFLTSVYVKNRKILDVGVKYNLPLVARMVEKNGDTKLKTRNVHHWNDLRFFAHLGYWWGFVFAEYRTVRFLKSNYPDTPEFTVGVRLTIPVEN